MYPRQTLTKVGCPLNICMLTMLSQVLGILIVTRFWPKAVAASKWRYYLPFKDVEFTPSRHFCVLYLWFLKNVYGLHATTGKGFFFSLHSSLFWPSYIYKWSQPFLVGTEGTVQSTECGLGNIILSSKAARLKHNIKVSINHTGSCKLPIYISVDVRWP